MIDDGIKYTDDDLGRYYSKKDEELWASGCVQGQRVAIFREGRLARAALLESMSPAARDAEYARNIKFDAEVQELLDRGHDWISAMQIMFGRAKEKMNAPPH